MAFHKRKSNRLNGLAPDEVTEPKRTRTLKEELAKVAEEKLKRTQKHKEEQANSNGPAPKRLRISKKKPEPAPNDPRKPIQPQQTPIFKPETPEIDLDADLIREDGGGHSRFKTVIIIKREHNIQLYF